jgi:uncharacterized repeat protein (TIGR02543 family)
LDAALVLHPRWTALPTYAVTYNTNGATSGTAPAAQTKTQGIALTLSGNMGALARTGHTFAGWNTAVGGTGTKYAEGSSYTAEADVVLYAQWTALPSYAVTYNSNGATSGTEPGAQTKTQGIALTVSGNTGSLAKTGHTFAGWNTAADGTGANHEVGASYTADAGVVLYAQWTALPTYAVTYNSNGATSGTAPAAQTKTQGVALTLSGNAGSLARTGHTFAGWNTEADGTGTSYAVGASYTAEAGVVLYAQWTELPTYAVTYNSNGATSGTAPAAQTKTQDVALTLSGNTGSLAKTGHTFAGWNTAADGAGANYAVGASYTADAGVVLYAQWTALPIPAPLTYGVTYDANGGTSGTVPAAQTKTHGVALALSGNTENLARTGYMFAGWNTAADGRGVHHSAGATYTADAALVLYAEWAGPINIAPRFNKGPDQAVAMGASLQTLANWATGISPGSAEESDQRLEFTLRVDRPDLFAVQPSISPTGNLSYQPSAKASGVARISVVLHDSGTTDNGGVNTSVEQVFLITVFSKFQQAGVYNGLVSADPGGASAHAKSGIVRMVVSKTGAFSASLSLGGRRYAASGVFAANGVANFGRSRGVSQPVPRKGLPTLQWGLSFDLNDPDKMKGMITDAGAPFAQMEADRAQFAATVSKALPSVTRPIMTLVPAHLLGSYTVVFGAKTPAQQGLPAAEFPQGDGYGRLSVSKSGWVKLAGRLADGSTVSAGNSLSKSLNWPFYTNLYGAKGSIGGVVTFRNLDGSDLDGLGLNWFRPAATAGKVYPKGWENGIKVDLVGRGGSVKRSEPVR